GRARRPRRRRAGPPRGGGLPRGGVRCPAAGSGRTARGGPRPAVLFSGSAIAWYGLWRDEPLTEFDGGKACFTHRLCDAWERAVKSAERHGVRVVRLRIGLLLGPRGGLLGRLLTPFQFALGGAVPARPPSSS